MNAPESQIPDEMLSAYLDGELSPHEVQEVASALEHSEELRALMADLKLIRSEIQSLPKHALSSDFAARVVESCSTTNATAASPKADVTREPQRSRLRTIGAVAAIAASLLIAMFAMRPGDSPVSIAKTDSAMQADVLEATSDADLTNTDGPANTATDSMLFRASEATEADGADFGGGGLGGGMKGGGLGSSISNDSNALAGTVASRRFDAVVRFMTPLAITGTKTAAPMLNFQVGQDQLAEAETTRDDALTRDRGLREFRSQSLSENSTIRSELDFVGVEVPEDAQFIVFEGTQAEIEDVIRELNTTPTSIELLGDNTNALALGLPNLNALAKSSEPPAGLRMMRSAAPVPSALADAPEASAAAAAAPLQEKMIEGQSLPAETDKEAKDEAIEQQIEAPRYRILLIGRPN